MCDSEVFALAYNRDASLIAVADQNGSLQIVSPLLGEKLNRIKDEQMVFPITQLAWKPVSPMGDVFADPQSLIGSCCDGSIIRWTSLKTDQVDHIKLNADSEYRSCSYSYSGRRFAVAGTGRVVEVYDDLTLKNIAVFSKEST